MEHAVIVHLRLSGAGFPSAEEQLAIMSLERRIKFEIERSGTGEFDGNEIGEGECVFYMYGPDADQLFATIRNALVEAPIARGGRAILRYGDVDDLSATEKRETW